MVIGPPITKIVKLKGKWLTTLIDTGSSDNFISARIVKKINLSTLKWDSIISMASSAISLKLFEDCTENIIFNGYEYKGIDFTVLPNSSTDIILGVPFSKNAPEYYYFFWWVSGYHKNLSFN